MLNDPVVTLTAQGEEADRNEAARAVLGDRTLVAFLDPPSWARLRAALVAAPAQDLDLASLDGRLFDASVLPTGGGIEVRLHDVTRFARRSTRLAEAAAEVERSAGDVGFLHEATRALADSTDTHELSDLAVRLVARLLKAEAVELQLPESSYRCGESRGPADGFMPLETALGRIGDLRWWRPAPVDDRERKLLDILSDRVSLGIEHALLLDATEARAHRDALTGLLNRSGALHALMEIQDPYAIALLDVDDFKSINSQFGTEAGDRVLQRLAQVLQQGRFGDVVARWGGEEFLVALPKADLEGAASRMRRVLERVQESVRAGVHPVSFSCGIALVGGEGLDRGLADADGALYRAKRQGRGEIVTAD